jgi:hypothetical protein
MSLVTSNFQILCVNAVNPLVADDESSVGVRGVSGGLIGGEWDWDARGRVA